MTIPPYRGVEVCVSYGHCRYFHQPGRALRVLRLRENRHGYCLDF